MKYLGLPLGGNPKAENFWNPVIEKVEKRLQSWKLAFLSRGGRLTLVQSVLGSLPTYFLSLFKAPKGVVLKLESLMRNFLWAGSGEGKKDHLIKWEVVSKTKEKGGLGIGNLQMKNKALLGKWLWRFPLEGGSLWHTVIRSKYGIDKNGWDTKKVLRVSSRNPWKDISQGYSSFLGCCLLAVGKGDRIKFWEDAWAGSCSLQNCYPRMYNLSRHHNKTISSMVSSTLAPVEWDFGFRRNVRDTEMEELLPLLMLLEHIRLHPSREDTRNWRLESGGRFTTKSYYRFLQNDDLVPGFQPFSLIWKSKIPSKVKVFMWLVAHGKVNTCDLLQRRRPNTCLQPHWCVLCKNDSESVNHVFLHCPFARSLWLKLFREFGISWVISRDCFSFLSENHKLSGGGKKGKVLWGCIISAVFWVIWLERNRRTFEDDYIGNGREFLWDKVRMWSSLWASVSTDFRDTSFSSIWLDWLAVIS